MIHHVDAAWNPAWQMDQVRPLTCDGESLVISGAPAIDPTTGEEVIYRIEFRKVRNRGYPVRGEMDRDQRVAPLPAPVPSCFGDYRLAVNASRPSR